MVGFESKIKQLCRERNITQKQLYAELDVTDAGMRKMFSRNSCDVSFLEKIADYFKVPIGIFFNDVEAGSDNIVATDNSTAFKGNGNTVGANEDKYLALLSNKDEQINRLLAIIEGMQK